MDSLTRQPGVQLLELQRLKRDRRRHETSSIVVRHAAFWIAGAAFVPSIVALLRRAPRAAWLAGFGAVAGAALVRHQFQRWFTEQPTYAVEGHIGDVEIRRYDPVIVARTEIAAESRCDAIEEGFDRLATYIFGGNRGGERLEMTAPVTHARDEVRHSSIVPAEAAERWVMTFTMSKGRPLQSFPRPHDLRVTLRARPSRRVAVLRYRGAFMGQVAEQKQRELLDVVEAAGLVPRGPPEFADYDPPWVLPFFRRNEAWVETETLEEQLERTP
jgi:hypothetical protein